MSPIRPPCSSTNCSLALHEHAGRAAARVVDSPLVRREHLDQHADHAARRVELPAVLSFGTGELREEVFVDAAQDVLRAVLGIAQPDRADHVDQLAQAVLVERRPAKILRQDSLEPRIVPLDGDHRLVDQLADRRLLGVVLQRLPASLGRHPENIVRAVLVRIFGIGPFAHFGQQLLMPLFEGVGDVLEEDQPQHDVLVLGRIHVVAELVSGQPELGLEAEIGGGVRRSFCLRLGHWCQSGEVRSKPSAQD